MFWCLYATLSFIITSDQFIVLFVPTLTCVGVAFVKRNFVNVWVLLSMNYKNINHFIFIHTSRTDLCIKILYPLKFELKLFIFIINIWIYATFFYISIFLYLSWMHIANCYFFLCVYVNVIKIIIIMKLIIH